MRSLIRKTAAICAIAMMLSSTSPVFAEGSKEFNEVPAGSNVNEYPAYRPYFEWRERNQFGEASENVMYVYAQKGETIYFGSDVTTAEDRSIDAIISKEITFTSTLDSTDKEWRGSSIAVTLPTEANPKAAFDPEGKSEEVFVSGSELTDYTDADAPNREAVYLFKPTENGKGHIANPTMEKNGPNGVNGTTEGYEPLSFVAPYEGTYSFRFLGRKYTYNEVSGGTPTVVTREITVPATKDGFLRFWNTYNNDGKTDREIIYTGLTTWSGRNGYVGFDLSEAVTGNIVKAELQMHTVAITDSPTTPDNGGNIHLYWLDYGEWTRDNMPENTIVLESKSMPEHNISSADVKFDGYDYHASVNVDDLKENDVFSVDITDTLNKYITATDNKKFTLAILSELTSGTRAYTQFASIENETYDGPRIVLTTEQTYEASEFARPVDVPWTTGADALVSAWDITVADEGKNAQPGRVWMDRFILNAGGFKKSIYPQFNVLTKEGFLYDVKLNGIQPWAFSFYSNNRGFLLDRWSLYSNPQLAYGDENATASTAALQALEHSFLSMPSGTQGDIGPAPIRKEVDGDGRPVMNKGNQMESTILGNHIPVDSSKDITHKIFFNTPDEVALAAYTEDGGLKKITDSSIEYGGLLDKIEYIGLGSSADNEGEVHYGTIGIGGRFEVTIDEEDAKTLNTLGSSSISILLDFSGYELDETGVPVPVLGADKKWKPVADLNNRSDAEKNNMVSLSAAIDNDTTAEKTYTLSWDGRDAYGNPVPKGEYTNGIKSYVEMGMAHFPILDAEHNPNGIKIKMLNEIQGNEDTSDRVYYNNEAVSPKTDSDDPSAWYYTNASSNGLYPKRIGDGLNRIGGVKTYFDKMDEPGAMVFDHYEEGEPNYTEPGSGYGNSAALDIWSKYEIKTNKEFTFGVAPIEPLKSYVSFVATDGEAKIAGTPFDVSHVNFAGERKETNPQNKGLEEIYGNTISTGFVASVSTTATGMSTDQLVWEITIPAKGIIDENDVTEYDSYIKIPTADIGEKATFTSQEDADEAEYLAYELFSGLFEDYSTDDEISVGDEFVPDWEADAGLNGDTDPGIMDLPDSAVEGEIGLSEEMYFETAALEENTAGDYKDKDWAVTINVEPNAVIEDAEGVRVNKGNIYKISTFKNPEADEIKIKLQHRIPIVTGGSAIMVGLIIDNLYAPAATAEAKYAASGLDGFHDITSVLFGGSNEYSVQASTAEEYATSSKNEYYIPNDINESLIMHITFDEDDKGEDSFEATFGGTVKENGVVSYEEGKVGNAVSMVYDGNNYLELPDGLFAGATSASVSFWLQQGDSFGWPFMTTTVSEMQTNNYEKYLGILLPDESKDSIKTERFYNSGSRPISAVANDLNLGVWNYITVNYEPNTTSIYVNGVRVASQESAVDLSNLFTAEAKTWIGHANWKPADKPDGEGFAGMIDEFRIYNRALTESEIQSLYNQYN